MAGKIDVHLSGSLIVLDVTITVTREGAGKQTPKETLASAASSEILNNMNASFRTELPAQVTVDSLRALAEQLGVNRNTIKAALDELTAQGWIVALPRNGAAGVACRALLCCG